MDRMSSKGAMVEDIRLGKIATSGFDLAHHNFGTGKLGKIIPTLFDEKYPGDRIKGRPICVTNFEPLAAPIMGNMIQKQEGFFVPYYQLWRNAPKFFTEKKGFNTPMPSVSPFDVYAAYADKGLLGVIRAGSTWISSMVETLDPDISYQTVNDFLASVPDAAHLNTYYAALKTFGETYYILDLITPVLKIHEKFDERIRKYLLDLGADTPFAEYMREQVAKWADELSVGILNYYFGVSSLFDYLKFPFPADFLDYQESWDFSFVRYINGYNLNFSQIASHLSEIVLNWMPFRAYYCVWYWNYRDQLLELDAYDPESDDFLADTCSQLHIVLTSLLRVRCWFKDAFTTALTNTGSGNFSVPASDFIESLHFAYYSSDGNLINTSDFNDALSAGATICKIGYSDATIDVPMNYLSGAQQGSWSFDNIGHTGSDYAVSLDLFDRIKRLRSFTQKHLINGYEMDDVIWASFEVKLSNVRMHIPEILMRGRDAVEMNTLVNNTSTTEQIAGDKTAVAYCKGQGSEMNYFSEEWGLYIQNMTIMPIQSYPNGMPRFYLKQNRLDFMWPEFATMGMDAIYNCELATLSELTDDDALSVFGYQGRYYDLKSRQDEVHGRFRTDLNYYVFGRKFDKDNLPKLNYIFVHCWPSLDMFVINSDLDDVFKYDCYNAIAEQRKLPVASEIIG